MRLRDISEHFENQATREGVVGVRESRRPDASVERTHHKDIVRKGETAMTTTWDFGPAGFWIRGARGCGPGPHGPRGGRGFWAEFMNEPPRRAERGEVKYLVLHATEEMPRHGYEIMQFIEEKSGGAYRPSPGVVYPTLQMLEELAHVRASDKDDRKVYGITDAGRRELDEHRDIVEEFYERSQSDFWDDHAEQLGELWKRIAHLVKGVRKAGRRGQLTPATMRKVWAVLDEAAAKIQTILGGE